MPKSKGNVIALPKAQLPGLGVAATAGTSNRIGGSKNEIWLCPAYDQNLQAVMLYVKIGLSTRAMLVEALASQLAHALKLNTPEPFLVTVNPRHVGRQSGDKLLAFGSLDLSERSMARPIKSLETLMHLLEVMKIADITSVFDEWIANDVRSPGDILICPESRVYLIDHEEAMGEDVEPSASITNWLASRIVEQTKDVDRPDLLAKLRARIAALSRVQLEGIDPPLAAQYSQDGIALYRLLLQFLIARLDHLDMLICRRVDPAQGYLPLIPPSVDEENDSRRAPKL